MSRAPSASGIVERVLTGPSPRVTFERFVSIAILCVLAVGPAIFSPYWVDTILTQTFIFGIAAASLIFLTAYGGMVSLAQTALMGVSGYVYGNIVSERGLQGESKGIALAWNPTLSLVVAIVVTTAIGLLLGAVAARSTGIYFLMLTLTYGVIAYYFFSQVTQFGGFSPIAGIDRHIPGFIGDVLNHADKLYYIALGTALAVYALIRYVVRTPFGLSLQGVRDDPVRMGSLGYNVALHRMLAFGLGAFFASVAGVLFVWWQGQIAPGDVQLSSTINLLVMAIIGGIVRIEGAWLGALVFIVMGSYITDKTTIPLLGLGGTLFGGHFSTLIGVIFLAIVVVSPDGLMGIWDRIMRLVFRHRGGGDTEITTQTQQPATEGST
jgi:branched-chain amino acid transport system permease protein